MNKTFHRLNLGVVGAVALAFSGLSQAQTIFSDSFENDGSGYGLPNSNSTPPYNPFTTTGVINTTPTDSQYNIPNGGVIQIGNFALTGQDGSNSLYIGNSGGSGDNDGPPFTDRTPSNQTITLTTVNGDAGTFQALTSYTLTFLAAGSAGDTTQSFTGSLLDGSNSTSLESTTVQDSTLMDGNFNKYTTLTFDTATSPLIVGDSIQIALQAAQTSAQPFNRGTYFDDVVLTAISDLPVNTPEPTSAALLLLGAGVLAVGFRSRFSAKRS